MAKYVNPVVFKLNKLVEENERLKGNTTEIKNEEENIINLDTILNQEIKKENVEIELIDFPRISKITGMAKTMQLSPNELGVLSIKYGNLNFEENHHKMI